MSLKKDKLDYILEYAFSQFQKFGFSKVTMDEIAKATNTGKGTLYRYFPSKEDLLLASLKKNIAKIQDEIFHSLSQCKDSNEKINTYILLLSKHLKVTLSDLSDIEKNVPAAYKMITRTRQRIVNETLGTILQEGKEQGIFRADLNIAFVINIFIGSTDYITRPEILDQTPYTRLSDVIKEMCFTILKGCYT